MNDQDMARNEYLERIANAFERIARVLEDSVKVGGALHEIARKT